MVSERTVVGVFHDAHELDRVVTHCNNARKDRFLVFQIGSNLCLLLSHADMRFVDQRRFDGGGGMGEFPDVRFIRMPYLGCEDMRFRILYGSPGVGGKPLTLATGPVHLEFVELAMLQRIGR